MVVYQALFDYEIVCIRRKPSLDGKDSSLRIRMSPEQKEKLVSYAERHYQTMSNVIFQALDILYAREEQQNNKE